MNVDKVILGQNCIYSMDCNETQLNNNIIVCGSSGCGKTMSISEPRLLETKNTSLVITMSKRRLVYKYKPLFLSRGYKVLDLNFVNSDESNVAYDPLAYVKDHTDVTFLASSIVRAKLKNKNTVADPYWDEAAISLLSAEIAFVMMTKLDNPSFTDVLELHDSLEISSSGDMVKTNLDATFECLKQKKPKCFAVSCWKSFKNLPVKTAGCVYGTLNTAIDTMFTPELRKMMAMSSRVDFEKLSSEKTVLFVTTSPVNPVLHNFVNMFYAQVFKQLFECAEKRADGVLPIPVHVLCDDFATGSVIQDFPEYISIFREKGISVTLLVQSESQLQSIYEDDDATTIINNCDTYVYMGGMDLKTARSVSERLNVPLDEILYMPVGKIIIFRRGQKPVVTERYDIRSNELYIQITSRYEKNIEKENDKVECNSTANDGEKARGETR